jgi:hypothetical protein
LTEEGSEEKNYEHNENPRPHQIRKWLLPYYLENVVFL